jgi:hypothetical protein
MLKKSGRAARPVPIGNGGLLKGTEGRGRCCKHKRKDLLNGFVWDTLGSPQRLKRRRDKEIVACIQIIYTVSPISPA